MTKITKPWIVHVASDHARSFSTIQPACGYALVETIKRGIGTRSTVKNKVTRDYIAMERKEGFKVEIRFKVDGPL